MANKKILNELIQINNQIINKCQQENNSQKLETHQLIASIIEEKNAFEKMDIEIALNIIVDILGDEKNAFDVYKRLMLTND